MLYVIYAAAALLIAALCYRLWRCGWPDDEGAREIVEEFARKFPGRCLVCSLHRYGYTHGHTSKPRPEPHDCIEAG